MGIIESADYFDRDIYLRILNSPSTWRLRPYLPLVRETKPIASPDVVVEYEDLQLGSLVEKHGWKVYLVNLFEKFLYRPYLDPDTTEHLNYTTPEEIINDGWLIN